MGIFKKAKKFMEDVDNAHDRINAGVHRVLSDEDGLMGQRDDARDALGEIRRDEGDNNEDDGRLVHFPNPARDWSKKKNQRFLDLTNTPEVLQAEEQRARDEQCRNTYGTAPATGTYEQNSAGTSASPCFTCGGPLTFIKQYQRWYCYKCRKYV